MCGAIDVTYLWAGEAVERPVRARGDIHGVVVHRIEVSQEDPSYGDDPSEIMRFFATHPVGREATGGVMPYALVIDSAGAVTQCVPLDRVAPHARAFNPTTIGVACVGDFRKRPTTEAQHRSLVAVCAQLAQELGLDVANVQGHDELAGASRDPSKQCPGAHLSMPRLRDAVASALRGPGPKVALRWELPRDGA